MYCRTAYEVNHVKCKPLFAVLLGLLIVGVTAGSISAMPYRIKASIRIKQLQYPTGRSTLYTP